jgi:Bacterial TniB protein
MSEDYAHLQPSVRTLAEQSAEVRVRRIRADRWITYDLADAALTTMEDLLTFPKRTRMPNLLLCGPTNNGKTMIVERFRRCHTAVVASTAEAGAANVPVLKVQMPAGPDESRFFGVILDELGLPYALSERVCKRQDAAIRMMRQTNLGLLIIDDLQNILAGSRLQQRRLLNLLRWLGNELQIPLAAVGTAEALHAIQSDDQLANRFEPIGLPPWRAGKEYQLLLGSLEAVLPLRRPSQLAKPALAQKILTAGEGILGEMVAIVTRAAVRAVTTEAECITPKLIDEMGFISPSKRRRVAV